MPRVAHSEPSTARDHKRDTPTDPDRLISLELALSAHYSMNESGENRDLAKKCVVER